MRQLTEKEEEILKEIKAGKVQREIISKLMCSSKTVSKFRQLYFGLAKEKNTKHENSFYVFKNKPNTSSESFIENAF